jgi:hypothetical protein
MDYSTPVFMGKGTPLPIAKQHLTVKELQIKFLRLERALALQVWRLRRCPRYRNDDRFINGFGALIMQQDAVSVQLDRLTHLNPAA